MRTTMIICIILTLGMLPVLSQDGKVNFAGTWLLNVEKSQPGDLPPGGPGGPGAPGRPQGPGGPGARGGRVASKMIVQQDNNKLVVESFRKNREGAETSTVATYTLDGKKCENKVMDRVSVSTAEWSEDGKSLIIQTEMSFTRGDEEFKMHSETTWTLNQNELALETTRDTPMGQNTSKAFYTREAK